MTKPVQRNGRVCSSLRIFRLAIVLSIVCLSSCSIISFDLSQFTQSEETISIVDSDSVSTPTAVQSGIDETQVQNPVTATPTDSPYDIGKKINVTQGPVIVSANAPGSSEYLYHDTVVTITLGNDTDVLAYVNLDNLSDNGMSNSDLEIEMTTGSMSFYHLFPANGTYYYFTGRDDNDFVSCREYFPIQNIPHTDYLVQEIQFISGFQYCVLTNENRIAIVNFVEDSFKYNPDYSQNISILVTVYSEPISDY